MSISKYRVVITQSETFEIDFRNTLSPSSKLVFLVNDLISLTNFPETNTIQTSEIEMQLLNEKITLVKDYQTKTLKILVNSIETPGNIYQILSEKTGLNINNESWKEIILDCNKAGITNLAELTSKFLPINNSPDGNIEALVTQASQGLSKEESDKLVRYREVSVKIKNMEVEVSSYQNEKKNKEEIKKDKERIDREVKAIDDKLSSVNMLIESQNRIKQELTKFNNITTDSTISQKVEKIKESRSQMLASNLRTVKKTPGRNIEEEGPEMPLFIAKWMVALVVLQCIFSLLFFIITLQLVQLFIGLFSAVTLLVLMLLVNINRYANRYEGRFTNDDVDVDSNNQLSPKMDLDENRLILNTAWVNALQGELSLIETTMNTRLGDKNLTQLSEGKTKLLKEQIDTDSKLKEIESKSINTEEYYKKRREVDILKIEKENIEFSLEGKMKPELEAQILEQMGRESGSVNVNTNLLPILIVNCNFVQEILDFVNNLMQSRQVLLINFA
ncbi:MAG: hypothetical protein ABI721_03990 [Candidatus Dojkabacteria bacterium]